MVVGRLDLVVENLESHVCLFNGRPSTIKLDLRPNEYPDLLWCDPFFRPSPNPLCDGSDLVGFRFERVNLWGRSVEQGDRVTPLLTVPIRVGHFRTEQAICLSPDLML